MKANRFTLAASYGLLLILLVAAGYIALNWTVSQQVAPDLVESQFMTPTASKEEVPTSTLIPAVIATNPAYPPPEISQMETATPELATPMDNSNSSSQFYPPPDRIEPTSVQAAGGTPYPGPSLATPEQSPPGLAYPGPGTDFPSPTQVAFATQGTGTPTPFLGTFAVTQTPLGLQNQEITTQVAAPTLGIVRSDIKVTDPKLFQFVSGRVQLVEFFAYWSPISKSMAPVLNVLADRYEDRINFVFLDIDAPENSLYKHLLGTRLPPIFLILDPHGIVIDTWDGYVSSTELENALQAASP